MLILIAGSIATGKTVLAQELGQLLPADVVRVRMALAKVLGSDLADRHSLQVEGARLDSRTSGRWLRDYLIEEIELSRTSLVVDSLRTELQTLPILESIVDSRLIFLTAHESTRRARYALAAADDPVKASTDFETAMHHPTETGVNRLKPLAHVVVETDEMAPRAVAEYALDSLR